MVGSINSRKNRKKDDNDDMYAVGLVDQIEGINIAHIYLHFYRQTEYIHDDVFTETEQYFCNKNVAKSSSTTNEKLITRCAKIRKKIISVDINYKL